MSIKDIDFDKLIEEAVNKKCEITINCSLDNIEIRIEPWEPFEYKCPWDKSGG